MGNGRGTRCVRMCLYEKSYRGCTAGVHIAATACAPKDKQDIFMADENDGPIVPLDPFFS